jgi:hypothetical protein
MFLGVKGGRRVRLTTSQTSVSLLPRQCGSLHDLFKGQFPLLCCHFITEKVTGRITEVPESTACIWGYVVRDLSMEYSCVPYGSHSKQRLFPHTALTRWAL